MNSAPNNTTKYSLALARKSLITAVIFTFIGTLALKLGPLCSKVIASCVESSSFQPTNAQIAPQYFHFSETQLADNLAQGKDVVLYFHAPWCTSCTSFDDELTKQSGKLPENVVVLQIPYDSAQDLKNKYHVLYQHTLVLLNQSGEIKESWIGGDVRALVDYLKKNS